MLCPRFILEAFNILMPPFPPRDPMTEHYTLVPEDSCLDREVARGLALRSGMFPEDSVMTSRIHPEYVFPYLKNPGTIRLSLFERQDSRGSWRVSRPRPDVGEYSPGYAHLHSIAPL
ncbi:hypothetical protein F511_16246 [Dorcoceras hygrometricum]|uniref:Uncharacterized protein n=1 Tax=Dorcoceras hygrometricum TaxID=472368 RepID=A0A2Z7BFU1_9LAMI|nr:hypothetical protein F511_16246 [Dorcoceras hygrometricum]